MAWPRTIRFRYTLRALLVFITLFALWGGYHANRGWKERWAKQTLLKHAQVSFHYGHEHNLRNPLAAAAGGYEWAVGRLWGDRPITRASVASNLSPEVVEALRSLSHLESLNLDRRGLSISEREAHTGAPIRPTRAPLPTGAMDRILESKHIRELLISGFELGNPDCAVIALHDAIEHLELINTSLSKASLARLLTLPRLRVFALSMSDITGADFTPQRGSSTLETIAISRTPISNDFGLFAAQCPKLSALNVTGESIDDGFVTALGVHRALEHLALADSSITDTSLALVQQMPALRSVGLPRNTVSQQGIDNLKKVRPNLVIVY